MLSHTIVTGLGFGDEGKGTIVDYLTKNYDFGYVVRHSGGPQAAHNVITDNGVHHTFKQFGSGTFNLTPTILSRFMSVSLADIDLEASRIEACSDISFDDLMTNLYISENALVITDAHVELNIIQEKNRGNYAHGSCNRGVGAVQEYALANPKLAPRVKDLHNGEFKNKLKLFVDYVASDLNIYLNTDVDAEFEKLQNSSSVYQMVDDAYISELIGSYPCVFEGSQGVLLDEWHGFHPHTTWSTVTDHNARVLLEEAGVEHSNIESIGVLRTYHTRHGFGPFPSEIQEEYETELFHTLHNREVHNEKTPGQGSWRVGGFDLDLMSYALDCMDKRPDYLAITHADFEGLIPTQTATFVIADTFPTPNYIKTDQDLSSREHHYTDSLRYVTFDKAVTQNYTVDVLMPLIEARAGIDIGIVSSGPTAQDKSDLRLN